ncbi:putative autophagy protein [Tricharina praecox]|uniref:putative autophagy protein n=1 Tax=Tricharina praecox TaxID=43433 RepID=UPI00222035F1|nr:putative autophagy protein [Tricharina praecox]KAI5856395.1 putative autophagy protein [Tricharina praecox]
MMLHSTFSRLRDYLTPASHTSTFASTGEITPEEFVQAGDYLVYKFPTWAWAAAHPSKRVSYLPDEKQYLVLKHAPCRTRLDDNFSTWNPGDEEGWDGGVAAAGGDEAHKARPIERVQSVGDSGDVEDESDDEIPDMDDEEDDDEAIIRDTARKGKGAKTPMRYYNLYLTYSTYFKVPRLFISGFDGATNIPLHPPTVMFEDISSDYSQKTVTIEPFPCLETPLQMASVHPCKHAETMKRIFDGMASRKARRDAAATEDALPADETATTTAATTTIETSAAAIEPTTTAATAATTTPKETEEWEQVGAEEDDGGLRVDQYLVVFVKFMAGVMPGVEMDYTMGI